MKSKHKKVILDSCDVKTAKELSEELGIKERAVRKLLEREKERRPIAQTASYNVEEGTTKDKIWWALLAILFTGFLLRLSGITWGMPLFDPLDQFFHADESKVIDGAVAFPQHIFTNTYLPYPTFFHYFIGILSLPLRIFFDQGSTEYYGYTHLLGRICSVLIGTGTILATYLLGKEIYDRKRALLASVFICFAMFHCQNSSWATVDVFTSLWVVIIFAVLRRSVIDKGAAKDYIFAGILFGFAMGTKQTCAVMLVAFFVFYVSTMIRDFPKTEQGKYICRRVFNPKFLLFGTTMLAGFLIATPSILVHFKDFVYWMNFVAGANAQRFVSRIDPSTWMHVLRTIMESVGAPLGLLFVFGLAFPLRKRKVEEIAMILVVLAYFFVMSSMLLHRYVIIVVPFLSILGSHAAVSLYESKSKLIQIFAKIIIVGTVLYSAFYCIAGAYLRLGDTRTQAAHYIEDNIPEGTTVGIGFASEKFSWRYHGWKYPKIDFRKYKEVYFFNRPDVLVLSSYDFVKIEDALKSEKMKPGYVWDERFNKEWYRLSPPPPAFFQFYDQVLIKKKGHTLYKTFKKSDFVPIEFPSPEIRIYKKI